MFSQSVQSKFIVVLGHDARVYSYLRFTQPPPVQADSTKYSKFYPCLQAWYTGVDGALAEKLGTGLQNLLDGSVTRTCLQKMISYMRSFFDIL